MAKKPPRAKLRKRHPPAKSKATPPTLPRRRDRSPGSMQALIHELQVHAEEITVQNQQLHRAQHELEEARDRFADLYDFAPIGFMSIDDRHYIAEINLAGAALLGRPRPFLLNVPLSASIVKHQRALIEDFLVHAHAHAHARARARARADGQPATSVEAAVRGDGHKILRFIARPELVGAGGQLFVAMVDVTEERRLDDERRQALEREQTLAADRAIEIEVRTVAETRVKALLERLVTAQEEERRRIARNLHDHLGQQLTALGLTLNAVAEGTSLPEAARIGLDRAQGIVSRMDRDVDLLAWDLRPYALDDVGLPAALSELVRQWTSVSQVPAEFHHSTPGDFRLPADTESNVYRVVQEALNNIAKHAVATHVSVMLEQRGDEAAVIIEDDGRGFDPERVLSSRERHTMMGLISMRERAALIDGSVEFESVPGQGTTVFVRIPVKPRR